MSRDVPSGWKNTILGLEVEKIVGGGTPARDNKAYWDGSIKWASVKDLRASYLHTTEESVTQDGILASASNLIPKGTVIIATRMAVGKVVRFSCDVAINQDLKAIIPKSSLTTDFLHHWLDWKQPDIVAVSTGTTVKGIRQQVLNDLPMRLPPLHEQRRIAEILSSIDEAIQTTQAVIDQTRTVKQGVLERLLTKGIGTTQTGWRAGKVKDFFELQRGFDITEKAATPGRFAVISSSGPTYTHNCSAVNGPTVITGRKGKLGLVHYSEDPCWPHDTTLWVKDFKGNSPKYIYWYLRGMGLEQFDAATAVPTLNRNNVHVQEAAFPPLVEQAEIASRLDELEAALHDSEVATLQMRELKAALMSDLLTGRVRVPAELPMAAE